MEGKMFARDVSAFDRRDEEASPIIADLDAHLASLSGRDGAQRWKMGLSLVIALFASIVLFAMWLGFLRSERVLWVAGIVGLCTGILWWWTNRASLIDDEKRRTALIRIRADLIADFAQPDEDED